MDQELYKSAESLIPKTYLQQAAEANKFHQARWKTLIEQVYYFIEFLMLNFD